MYSMKSFKIYKYVNNHLQPLKKLEMGGGTKHFTFIFPSEYISV